MRYDFVTSGGLILVAARIFGPRRSEVVALALDTGSTRTIVRRELLDELGYDPAASGRLVRTTTGLGTVEMPEMRVDRMESLGQVLSPYLILSHRFPPMARIEGVIGLDFMRDRWIGLDFRAGTIDIE